MRDSLAKTLAQPENRQGLAKKQGVACTAKSYASLAWYDPATCSLKMSQQSLLTDLQPSSLTLPPAGMTQNGYVYALPIVGRIITGIGGGVLPTPTANEDAAGTPNGKMQLQLGNHPLVRGNTEEEWAMGTLNPKWVCWLMGWPLDWFKNVHLHGGKPSRKSAGLPRE
jgi:hypothetical protein